jgi:hypothetical protein
MPSRVSEAWCVSATFQIDVFTTEMSCLTIVWATIQGIRLRRVPLEETEGVVTKEGAIHNRTSIANQPPGVGEGESGFCVFAHWPGSTSTWPLGEIAACFPLSELYDCMLQEADGGMSPRMPL